MSALTEEIGDTVRRRVVEARRRRAARNAERRTLAARRTAGLRARHARKIARTEGEPR